MRTAISVLCATYAAVFLLQGAASWVLPKQDKHEMSAADKVRECVFRYQFSKFGVTDRDYNSYFFVGVDNHGKVDPSPVLLAALQSKAYSVKAKSQCKETTLGVFDVSTHKQGLLFTINDLKLTSAEKAAATATLFKRGLAGNVAAYTLAYKSGAWKVTKCEIKAIF